MGAMSEAAIQPTAEIQPFGALRPAALALGENVRTASVLALNQVLADTISLRDLYRKHHWQVSGPTFHRLHLLHDKHAREQAELIDDLAERVMASGGVSVGISHDVAEATKLPRPQGPGKLDPPTPPPARGPRAGACRGAFARRPITATTARTTCW